LMNTSFSPKTWIAALSIIRISPDSRKPAMIASSTAIENAFESFVNWFRLKKNGGAKSFIFLTPQKPIIVYVFQKLGSIMIQGTSPVIGSLQTLRLKISAPFRLFSSTNLSQLWSKDCTARMYSTVHSMIFSCLNLSIGTMFAFHRLAAVWKPFFQKWHIVLVEVIVPVA
jgi:hypothetical protein